MEFIYDFVKWSKDKDMDNCLILNFGYINPLAYFQISADLPISFNLKSFGMATPHTCSIVIIANKNLREIEKIINLLKDFIEESLTVPLALFIMSDEEENVHFKVETKKSYLPTMV